MAQDKIIEVKNLCYSYGKNNVLDNLNISIKEGKITTLIGSNGCGKSTLFNILTKNLKKQSGDILIGGKHIDDIKLRAFSKKVAIVHQYNTAPDDLSVEALISYGRIPYHKYGQRYSDKDRQIVDDAMKITGVYDYRDRYIRELSGGQKQRVFIAMAIAQNTKILFLDEPTTYLDIRYQIEILRLIRRLNREQNITIIMVLHDINQACAYSDEIIALDCNGKVAASGNPNDIVDGNLMKKVYGIELRVSDIDNQKVIFTV